jgi:Tol biopolymer transport system component
VTSARAAATAALGLAALVWTSPAEARNKVRDERFDWRVLRSERFDVHFYGDEVEPRAREVASWLERACERTSRLLGVELLRRVPVFLYRSHNDFEQTNLYPGVPEGVGGFAEPTRDRMVFPLYPSERYMQRLVEHELTHVTQYTGLYRYRIPSYTLLKHWLFPTWFIEGSAEFMSPYRDSETEMWMRDAALDGKLTSLNRLRGFAHLDPHEVLEAYTQGAYFMDFLERTYGKGAVARLLGAMSLYVPWRTEPVFRAAFGAEFLEADRLFRRELAERARRESEGRGDPGGGALALTETPGHYRVYNRSPRWSPDGGRIALLSDRRELTDIHVMNADGSGRRSVLRFRLNRTIDRVAPSGTALGWSPDGTMICFVGERVNRDRLYLVEVDRPGAVEAVELPLDEIRSPDFGPGGGRIALSGVRAGVSDVYVLDLETRGLRRLTSDRSHDESPRWRPDGREIVYVSERGGQTDLFAVDTATGEAARLTDTFSMERDPAWSPDGTRLAYSSDAGGVYDLWVMEKGTGKASRLTRVKGGCFSPTWSAAGDELAFSYFRHGRMNVFRMEIEAGEEAAAPPREEERAAEYERYFTEPDADAAVEAFRDRVKGDYLLPLYFVNLMDVRDLRGDHALTASVSPRVTSAGSTAVGDVTWWDLSRRPDVAVSLFAEAETGEGDGEERRAGVRLFSRYAFDHQLSFALGYVGYREEEFEGGLRTYDALKSGLFAEAVYDNTLTRGLDTVGGTRLRASAVRFGRELGGDVDTTELGLELEQHLPLSRDVILKLGLDADSGEGPDLVLWDLARVVRGVGFDLYEGPGRLGLVTELRFPLARDLDVPALGEWLLLKDLRAYVFADAGFVTFIPLTDFLRERYLPDWIWSYGAGLRLDFWLLQKVPVSVYAEVARPSDGSGTWYAVRVAVPFSF